MQSDFVIHINNVCTQVNMISDAHGETPTLLLQACSVIATAAVAREED